ncbi:proline dipeptidase [Marinomonas sp. MED121]|uniref:M24 family metallopeptidase n=1 Tax=Marinomonas sp. MED121 TaxID=314277 RepID=UPI0000691290|nr:Xaa-Pro peptidase family protein [Marinomonas sp. MED121]EAQ63526.1 proline dipeptidase [Marinomonas sp. MED121]
MTHIIAPNRTPSDCQPTDREIQQIQLDRLQRVRNELIKRNLDACVLFDPTHIRYATGSRNMQVYSARNPARYAFISAQGSVVMFEFGGCLHLAETLNTVDEVRPAKAISYYFCESFLGNVTAEWAAEIDELVIKSTGKKSKRIAIESATSAAAFELQKLGYQIFDAQEPLEQARCIKVPNELKMIRASLRATEEGVRIMESKIKPGISENELWSHLHQHVIATDGDYVETRLLSSGPRTNPWFQECSSRPIEAGDLVALDTDVVGKYGYYADFSRTFLCGDMPATAKQKELYKLAHEQVMTNIHLLQAGRSFKEYAERAWRIPDSYKRNRYFALVHGVGMTGEYPYVVHREDIDDKGYDGIFLPGMTICVESYIGHEDGGEGVKLEEQIYIGENHIELLSDYPFDERLMAP